MASNADVTNICSKWKEQLESLIIPEFEADDVKRDELGSGLYGETSVVSQNGVGYSVKKILGGIYSKDEFRANFADDCLVLSRLRHPHVAQFLGVQIGDAFTPPVIVSELYPLSLSTCLQRYPEIPSHSKYSILLESTVGVEYLHQISPPVIHGHLTPNNILLTEGLHVKITDCVRFGLNISPPTNTPYQAPEETLVKASDVFSLGDIMLQFALQKEPSPLEYKHHRNPENKNEPFILTELKRRERFLLEVEDNHKLKDLILRCLEEEPSKRPTTRELNQELDKIAQEYKPEYSNILEMFMALGQLSLMKDSVSSLEETVKAKEEEIEALKEQMEPLKEDLEAKEDTVTCMKEEIEGYKQALQSKEGRVKSHESGVRAKDALLKAKERELAAKKQVIAAKEAHLKSANKRILVLEQHIKAGKKGSSTLSYCAPPTPTPPEPKTPERNHSNERSQQSSPESTSGRTSREGGLKPGGFQPYRGITSPMLQTGTPMHADTMYRSATMKIASTSGGEADPQLAKILARRNQKIATDKDSIHESEIGSTQPAKPKMNARKRSKTVDIPESKELRKILEKRKSFVDES